MAKKEQSQEDLDFEIKFCEGLLEKNENFLQALILLGELYTRRGFFEKGLWADERLSQLQPADPIVFYNLACSYSLLNRVEQALETMKRAIALGYDNFAHLGRDRDLENLFKDSRFREYLNLLKAKAIPAENREV
jgi:tetratricopeptide (TPR) repeat protein